MRRETQIDMTIGGRVSWGPFEETRRVYKGGANTNSFVTSVARFRQLTDEETRGKSRPNTANRSAENRGRGPLHQIEIDEGGHIVYLPKSLVVLERKNKHQSADEAENEEKQKQWEKEKASSFICGQGVSSANNTGDHVRGQSSWATQCCVPWCARSLCSLWRKNSGKNIHTARCETR